MEPVILVIKNPAAQNVVHRVEVTPSATIHEVKSKLSLEYPGNPPIPNQRLIFGGRVLADREALSDVLAQHDMRMPQTFHIVVSSTASPAAAGGGGGATGASHPSSVPSSPYAPHAPRAQMHAPATPPIYPPQPGMYPAYAAHHGFYGGYPPSPHAYYQHMQYAQQYGGAGAAPYGAPPNYPPQFTPPHQQPPHMHQHQQPPPPQPQPQQQVPPQQPAQQAAAIRVQLGGAINLTLLIKLSILVFILSQGGGPERAFWLMVGALVVYLYLTGLVWPARFGRAPNAAAANGNGNVNGNGNGENDAPEAQEPQPGLFPELQDFVLPFFYSLIPSWNPPPRVAPPLPIPQPVPAPAAEPIVEPHEPHLG